MGQRLSSSAPPGGGLDWARQGGKAEEDKNLPGVGSMGLLNEAGPVLGVEGWESDRTGGTRTREGCVQA